MAHIVIDARLIKSTTGRYMQKLVQNLAKLPSDHRITILIGRHDDPAELELPEKFEYKRVNYPIGSIGEQIGLNRRLKKLRPDLVHFGMTQQPILYKGRKITTIHDLTTIRFENPARNRWIFKFKQKIYEKVVKNAAQQSAYVITPSQYVKQDVAQYAKIAPEKIFVTYEAADRITAPAKPVPRLEGKQFIMYVGRATPHKNLVRLVRAFELLRKKYPSLMLVLAGANNPNYHRLGALVTEKRLAHSIVFTDFVSEGELRWLYQNCAAYVFPSLSEGFGLPGLEAMMHGAPVVSSSATCLPEIYGDAAHYFDPHSVTDIATKIHDVLSKSSLRLELIRRGQARAAKYSWRRTAHQTLELYDKSLD